MRTYQWLKCRILAEACVIALLFVGCNSAEPAAPEPPGEPALGLRVEPRSDTLATGLAGSRLASVPVVRVTLDGNPAPGREVQFILSGGGSITFLSQRTDTAGLASPGTWTLGTAIGPERLVARVGGAADLVFTALVTAGPPATMEIVAGNHQSAAVRAPLPAPLRVKLADQYGNPAAGATVSYTVVAGSGTVLDARATADSLGFATSGVWTLGGAGGQAVRASVVGKSVYFDALACENPCRGRDLLFTRGAELYSSVDGVTTLLFAGGGGAAAWSRDGERIAFTVYDWSDDETDLYLMNADGSDAATRAFGFGSPSWSPDGQHLAVGGPEGVYVLSPDDGSVPSLLAEHGTEPAWSPDGAKIAFVEATGVYTLKVMNTDGSGVTTLAGGSEQPIGHPTWSPDGLRLAFTKCAANICSVFAVSAGGANLVQLAATNTAWGPVWSPEGSRIAFTSGSDIVWVPADGSLSVPIVLVPDAAFPAWRP